MLGSTVREPIEHVEVFPAPAHVTEVRLSSDEVTSVCPVTSQPDLASIEIAYERAPDFPATPSAPSMRMWATFRAWRRVSISPM